MIYFILYLLNLKITKFMISYYYKTIEKAKHTLNHSKEPQKSLALHQTDFAKNLDSTYKVFPFHSNMS